MTFDLLFRNCVLPGGRHPVDVAVAAGRIAAIAPLITCDAPEVDCGGRLLCAGLSETHIHLDKTGILSRCSLCAGTLAEAVAETSKAKAAFTRDDVYARARKVLEQAVSHGTQRLRTFAEVDPRAGFRSLEAILQLREEFRGLVDVQVCAFAQEGLTNDPGTYEMLDEALLQGADLAGGCPYTDPDPKEHIRLIFALAEKHGTDVDFHLDFDLEPAGSNLPFVITETIRRGYQGRVSVGHVTKLSALPPDEVDAIADQLAAAGITVTLCPATDLYLNGRNATQLVPRGVAPGLALAKRGVNVTLATNNVLNPFTPYGDASLIRMANLYANVAQCGLDADMEAVFAMISTQAAAMFGGAGGVPATGMAADLVLVDAASAATAVAAAAPVLAGWKGGVQTFVRPPASLLVQPAHTPHLTNL